MQRVTPRIGGAFGPVEEDIATAFLPALFEDVGDEAPGRAITRRAGPPGTDADGP